MLSAQAWNWGALCGWFWLGTNLISITYCFFRLPETKVSPLPPSPLQVADGGGAYIWRTRYPLCESIKAQAYFWANEIQANKVAARRFASTKVNGTSHASHWGSELRIQSSSINRPQRQSRAWTRRKTWARCNIYFEVWRREFSGKFATSQDLMFACSL